MTYVPSKNALPPPIPSSLGIKDSGRVAILEAEVTPQQIMRYVNGQDPDLRFKPKPPILRLVREGDFGPFCPACGSSFKRFFGFRRRGCVQPECRNYYAGIK